MSTNNRVVPFHCPYCAEEDLRPEVEPRGAWSCGSCLRVFTVQFHGLRGQAAS